MNKKVLEKIFEDVLEEHPEMSEENATALAKNIFDERAV